MAEPEVDVLTVFYFCFTMSSLSYNWMELRRYCLGITR